MHNIRQPDENSRLAIIVSCTLRDRTDHITTSEIVIPCSPFFSIGLYTFIFHLKETLHPKSTFRRYRFEVYPTVLPRFMRPKSSISLGTGVIDDFRLISFTGTWKPRSSTKVGQQLECGVADMSPSSRRG
jgi:hypothetical protein